MGSIKATGLSFTWPDGVELFRDVSFTIGDGQHAAILGTNGVGKTTVLSILAGKLKPTSGTARIEGQYAVMSQAVADPATGTTVRGLLASLAGEHIAHAAARLEKAERDHVSHASDDHGIALGEAHIEWNEVGGYSVEAQWDAACMRVLRKPLVDVADRNVFEVSGGERKRLALEALMLSSAEVLLLDEPDNYLDLLGKLWLEELIRESSKTIAFISHDRSLIGACANRIVTVEPTGAWTHGGSYYGYEDARSDRDLQLGDALERWENEERRLFKLFKDLKVRAASSSAAVSRANAAETQWKRFLAAGPPPAPVRKRTTRMKFGADRTGDSALVCEDLELLGLTDAFSIEIYSKEQVAIVGPNGSGKSHFVRLLGGDDVEHEGALRFGSNVRPGLFVQTTERTDLMDRTPRALLAERDLVHDPAIGALARYAIAGTVDLPFEDLSGGQQARMQILLLELAGANLLVLDEPTDNLDVDSADSLASVLDAFPGTVVAVTHDRWFMERFDRFVVFDYDCSVVEVPSVEAAVNVLRQVERRPKGTRVLSHAT